MSAAIEQRNQDATVYVGNLDDRVSEELLWELMLQAGSVSNVHMPRDKVTGSHQNYGFVEFRSEEWNLDPEVDEKLLYDTFSAFGGIIETPKIMRDPETKGSRGFGFVSFDSFEAADLAIECMHGQYLCNRQVVVQYAFKKDSQNERHGSEAERLLAQRNPNKLKPHTMFAFTAAGGGPGIPGQFNQGGYMMDMGMMPPPPPPPQNLGMGMTYPPPPVAMMGVPPPPPPPQMR
ncbi:unnamed protein product [Peronospora belbahrii]|uniref:RRM domain-containing protein n=1 Tax=Peronospora belbahrii TaxID=622444 RepID=A0AAU9L2I0_9STRA|nr:unnamed protein product [Peronospora belbahrii]